MDVVPSHLKLKKTSSRFSAISHWMTVSLLELTTMKGTKICPIDTVAWHTINVRVTSEAKERLVRKRGKLSIQREQSENAG